MASILSSIVFVKTVSGEKVCMGTAYSRVDNEEFVKLNFKAFRRSCWWLEGSLTLDLKNFFMIVHFTNMWMCTLKMGTAIKMLQLLMLQHSVATLRKNTLNVRNVRNYFLYPQLSAIIRNVPQIKLKFI